MVTLLLFILFELDSFLHKRLPLLAAEFRVLLVLLSQGSEGSSKVRFLPGNMVQQSHTSAEIETKAVPIPRRA